MTRNYPVRRLPERAAGAYTLSSPIVSDLTHVRWIDNSTVYIFSERYGSLMRSVNGGQTWSEINRQADGTCRIDQHWIDDVFVLPSNPNHMLFLGGSNGYVYLSTNGLTSTAAHARRRVRRPPQRRPERPRAHVHRRPRVLPVRATPRTAG